MATSFGKLMRAIRTERGIDISEIVKEVGISYSYASLLGTHDSKQPSVGVARKIIRVIAGDDVSSQLRLACALLEIELENFFLFHPSIGAISNPNEHEVDILRPYLKKYLGEANA